MASIERREVAPKSERGGGRALVGIETKHLLRSILLGIGTAGAIVAVVRGSSGEWPALTGADGIALRAGDFMGGFALLTGAWLGLRDRRTGVHELIGSTPTSVGKVIARRTASLAIVSALAFAIVFLTSIVYTLARGGHGTPDLRLLLDGALATTLASWVGFAIGTLTRSIVVSLFAAPIYGLLSSQGLMWQLNIWKSHRSIEWITPSAVLPDRSPTLGFFPDIFWMHPLLLAGAAAFVAGVVAVAAGEGPIGRRLRRPGAAVVVLGLATALTAGGSLLAKPDGYTPNGSDPATWLPVYDIRTALIAAKPFRFDDDHRATTCAKGRVLTACVYPAFGARAARLLVARFELEAEIFHGLPGVPTMIRMVPAESLDCLTSDGAMAYTQDNLSFLQSVRGAFVDCITEGSLFHIQETKPSDAREAVKVWYLLQSGGITRAQMIAALSLPTEQECTGLNGETCYDVVKVSASGVYLGSWKPAVVRAGLAMNQLPAAEVIRGLQPVWTRVRAGTLALDQLPGATS